MKKTTKYAILGVFLGGLINILLNYYRQKQEIDKNSEKEVDWNKLLKAGGKGAAIGGFKEIQNKNELPLNTNKEIKSIVANSSLNKNNKEYKLLSSKANTLSRYVSAEFSNKIGGKLERMGSTEEGTALSNNYDIDISVPFKPNSFASTEEMYDQLYSFLKKNYNDSNLYRIRRQRKSLGLIYKIDGEEYKIDLVPYKQSKNALNNTTGYLYNNKKSIFESNSYTKTDIGALNSISLSNPQQQILVALKSWKLNKSVPIGSHLMKSFIKDAYKENKGKIPKDITGKIVMVVSHIEENIMTKRIQSIENTNNILTDISKSRKSEIKSECSNLLGDYAYQPNSILKYIE